MNDEKIIRKLYGEKMWHLCRDLFATLLDMPGLLSILLEDHFNPSRFLYDDIVNNNMEEEFKDYIYSFIDVENNNQIIINKSVKELLSEAGYDFYECHTEDEIRTFKKYYAPGETLCTFNGGRLNRCYVFFAVRKDVENIRRENFSNPKREDEYGTSVISIQFTRGSRNTLSIKNRYNHTVNNPDATFSNNLENIIPGLTNAFQREYNLNINQNDNQDFEILGYVRANNGKLYKYNYEINNIYYCLDNIIIDHFEVKRDYQEKEKYLIFDYFILDLVNKEIRLYDKNIIDSFSDFNINIDKIDIKNIDSCKQIDLTFRDRTSATMIIDNTNRLISYSNKSNIKSIGYSFLHYNQTLKHIDLCNVETLGSRFIYRNQLLNEINLPNVQIIENDFLHCNQALKQLDLPNVKSIGNDFLFDNNQLTSINLPNVKYIGNDFLFDNNQLTSINLPNVETIGQAFLYDGAALKQLDLPCVQSIGDDFLCYNISLIQINLPNVKIIKDHFLSCNKKLIQINLPSVEIIGESFLYYNETLTQLDLPNVQTIGNCFLFENEKLVSINLPSVTSIGEFFLFNNKKLVSIDLPNVISIGDYFLYSNDFRNINRGKRYYYN